MARLSRSRYQQHSGEQRRRLHIRDSRDGTDHRGDHAESRRSAALSINADNVLKDRVTALVGCALGLAPSMAGAKTADAGCLTVCDGYWQVATLDVCSGRTHVVTHSAIDKTRVSWFPNGRLLVNRTAGA